MAVVYQIAFVLHIYQVMKLCKYYFITFLLSDDEKDDASELKRGNHLFFKLLTYIAVVSLTWPFLSEFLGCDPSINRFFILSECSDLSYVMVAFNVFAISALIVCGWSFVWLVKATRKAFSK